MVSQTSIRKFCALVLFTVAGCNGSPQKLISTSAQIDVGQVVARHDSALRNEIGIGLKEVGLIVQTGPRIFILEDAMQPAEKLGYRALIEHGYATADKMTASEGIFVRYHLTDKGLKVQQAIR